MAYSERLNDIAILQLNTEGFEQLTFNQKQLAFYLAQAGLWGRAISMDQGSPYNLVLIERLMELYIRTSGSGPLHGALRDSLFVLFAHNGMYHSMSGERLELPLTRDLLEEAKAYAPQAADEVLTLWFETDIPQHRTVQTEGVDGVAQSGGNFYENLTTQEVVEFRQSGYPTPDNPQQVPPYGYNERLVKTPQGIERQVISRNALYGPYVAKIIENLQKALPWSENDAQRASIETLIQAYETGDAKDFDTHCVAWTQDRDSHVYFINGLIESYEDPLGVGCTFESVVAFKNPIQTAKVQRVIDNIQWFEDQLPFEQQFKKEKAVGLSASSITVVSMAGETAPSLPLGVNLPNSDWIRSVHGSKSVNLDNVASSRSAYEVPLREALYLPRYHGVLERYVHMTNSLHTDLHEIAGHGSGKLLEGVQADVLGVYYSTIEEARADLVALYFIADQKLQEIGVYDGDVNVRDAALAQYVAYLTNGAIGQLRRVTPGADLTQAHFRNRQMIAQWVLRHGDPSKVGMVQREGRHYIEVHDIEHVRELFGQLLAVVQRIKSTGDAEKAKELVMTYGTKVDQVIHQELVQRLSTLDMPKVVGFVTPELHSYVMDVKLHQPEDFLEQQLQLHEAYVLSLR